MDIASVRILRLAFGTASCLWFSQAIGWSMSFVAPIITLFVLSLPIPMPKFKFGAGLIIALWVAMAAGTLLLPPLIFQPWVGVILTALAFFWVFYFTAKGGPQAVGGLATMGIAVSLAVGTVSLDLILMLISGLIFAASVGVVFVWIAHWVVPDRLAGPQPAMPAPQPEAAEAPKPELSKARHSALRSTVMVFPIMMLFLLSASSTSYLPVMIKGAAMGQQATNRDTRKLGRSLLLSTLLGGIAAIIAWQILSIMPTLTMYTLVVAIAALIFGRRIFEGRALSADAETWSYGFLTFVVLLAPAVNDGLTGSTAGASFWSRMFLFAATTVYAVAAVYIYDAFVPERRKLKTT